MKIYIAGHKSPDLDAIASPYEYAEFIKKTNKYEVEDIIPARVGDVNKETVFIFDKFDVDLPKHLDDYNIEPGDKFILVDHNESSQRHEKIDSGGILEIVDHHKINVDIPNPIEITIKPLGSTSSIIYKMYKQEGIEPSKKVSSLVLSGILSDTVGLKSSTTTEEDIRLANEIANNLGIDIDDLTFEIFKTKSDITGLKPMQIAKKDFKTFDFGNKKVFINQVETVEPEKIVGMKDELVKSLGEIKNGLGCDFSFIIVTDILKVSSQVIYSNNDEKTIVDSAFDTKGSENIADIGPKISRKKDIAPEIEKVVLEDFSS